MLPDIGYLPQSLSPAMWDNCLGQSISREVFAEVPTRLPGLIRSEPEMGFEPMTCALRVRCSTTELPGQ